MKRLLPKQTARVLRSALTDDNMGAGIQLSGVSGSGKSRLLVWIVFTFLSLGIPGLFLDPHGDAVALLRRMTLTLPRRRRKKIWFWRPADGDCTAGINPFLFREEGLSSYQRAARLRVRSELFSSIVLSDYGETEFAGRTRLRKHFSRTTTICGESRLPPAFTTLLVDTQSPLYPLLCQLAPDEMDRYQMEMIAAMRPADQEAEVGSLRNRLMSTLGHPTSDMLFSRWDNVIDFEYLYDNDITLLVDLSKLDLLTDGVQQLLANTTLLCMQSVVMSKPEHERRRRFCALDELPLFASSFPLLQTQCTEIRKFCTKYVFSHQGSARFPGRHDNEFLNTLTDMCRLHVFFRHGAGDAKFFGEQISLSNWNKKNKVKHIQRTPQQFTEGHEIVELTDHATANGDTSGTAEMGGTTNQISEALQTAADAARMSRTSGHSDARQHTQTRTDNRTHTETTTWKQTLVPKVVTRDVVTAIQFYTPEELDREDAARIREFDTREAFLLIDGLATYEIQTPKVTDPYATTPRFARRKLNEWFQRQIANRPEFSTPLEIERERQAFLERLISELQRMAYERPRGTIVAPSRLLIQPQATLILPDDAAADRQRPESQNDVAKEATDAPWEI
ncbi:AAA-like domain protein [Symmachiella dynata]|uniref:AAA-like domain protein n=1 Tax=Symmachiella dynata TaxID=2527995 RepID=A0A517ZK89_9PLAN|nr:hypothetical protein [Symmachiella dynata]QDU42909.1 AAA-like domain protein [Symmachiella dynata]